MMTIRSILIVDDEENQRFIVEQALRTLACDRAIATVSSVSEALSALDGSTPDLIITDYHMPVMNGLELIAQIRRRKLRSRIILMTAYSSPELYDAAQQLKIDHYITKPVAITIQGANDHPVVLAGGTSGEVSEGAPTTPASGQLQATDPDGTFLVWGEQNVMGLYGNFHLGADGAWNYLLDAGDLDTVALGLGQSGVDTFEARVQDQLGAFATVQVAVNVLGA